MMALSPGEIEPEAISVARESLSTMRTRTGAGPVVIRPRKGRESHLRFCCQATDSRVTRAVMFVEVGSPDQRSWHGSEPQAESECARPRVRDRRSDDHRLSFAQLAG
jgi:hypothetical protein